ncbi:CDP-alcohol phosphatidyltransferase family protein [Candidatus Saccharibacteria bacterium]|nr:CDP-alcohol phosphatidyltransferase family protein [Candidatus Saccharibacteria bacterium]
MLTTILYIAGYIMFLVNINLPYHWYFIVVVLLCKFLSRAYFAKAIRNALGPVEPFSAPSIRGALFTVVFGASMFFIREYSDAQLTLLAFVTASVVFATIVDAIKSLYVKDCGWLVNDNDKNANPTGFIGIPNIVSTVRIAIAAALPPLVTWFSAESCRVMCFIALVAVILTDWIDGHIARAFKSVTKAGKYLDPLGDKVLFIPNAIAFSAALAISGKMTTMELCFLGAFILITIARDVLFFIWFARTGMKIPQGIGAGNTDKIRMVVICCWLIVTANIVTIGFATEISVIVSLALAAIIAILSGASVFIDKRRLKELKIDHPN